MPPAESMRAAAWPLCVLPLLLPACTKNDLHQCAHTQALCKRDGFTQAMSASLSELTNGNGDDEPHYRRVQNEERAVAIEKRRVVFGGANGDAYTTLFEATVDSSIPAKLEFAAQVRPWGVAPLPDMVRYAGRSQAGPCVTLSGDGYADEELDGSSVRDLDGSLLLGSERSRLRKNGKVERAANIIPEIDIEWFGASCPQYCGTDWREPGDELWHSVALRVSAKGAKTTDLLPGDHMKFEIDGQRYVFVLENAATPHAHPHQPVPDGKELCGRALWSLYRDGLVIDVNETGEAPKAH